MMAAMAPPADMPAIYTRRASMLWEPSTSRVIPAMIDGSP